MKYFEAGTKSYVNVVKGSNHQNSRSQHKKEGSKYTQERQSFHEQRVSYSKRYYTSRYSYFNGQCFTCHNFGNKAVNCVAYKTIMTREEINQYNSNESKKSSYNSFYPLQNEV